MRNFADEVRELLNNNDFHFVDVYSVGDDRCAIYLCLGDWKHDHARLKILLRRAGYDYDMVIENADSYDGCFSATYYVTREVA